MHFLEEVSQEERNSKKSPICRFSDLPNFSGVKVHQEKLLANLFSHTSAKILFSRVYAGKCPQLFLILGLYGLD